MYINQLTIIGFTGQDAELHYTQNGTPVTTLSVATKESWKNDRGEWQSRTEWHSVVAEHANNIAKGTHLMVQGSLRSRGYEKDVLLNLSPAHNDYKGLNVKRKAVVWLGSRGPRGTDERQGVRLLNSRAAFAVEEMGCGSSHWTPAWKR